MASGIAKKISSFFCDQTCHHRLNLQSCNYQVEANLVEQPGLNKGPANDKRQPERSFTDIISLTDQITRMS